MNSCIFKGNLTRDPETTFTAGNIAIVKVGMAVNERVKKGDQWEDKANFLDVVAFGKRGEVFAQHHRKGDPVLIRCRASFNQWQDQQGNKRSKVEFILDDFDFIKPRDSSGQQPQRPAQQQQPQGELIDETDVPF